jgi:dTDP-4-dehydrorhamnose 3,5-epimerase
MENAMLIARKHTGTLEGVFCHAALRWHDRRGWFSVIDTATDLERMGFRPGFFQTNLVRSIQGVVRGMHRQDQTKYVISGRIYDVALNPETGEWCGYTLEEGESVLIPSHLAHGYQVLTSTALVMYTVDKPFNPEQEEVFAWNGYGIEWAIGGSPILSDKDEPK